MEKEEEKLPDTLYHYTTMETLFKILEKVKKPNGTITMWAPHHAFKNDPSECDFIYEIIALRLFGSEVFKRRKWLATRKFLIEPMYSSVFLCSLSEESNSLPMWNTYGQQGKGVAIGFNYERLAKEALDKGWRLKKCTYPALNCGEESKDSDLLKEITTKLRELFVERKETTEKEITDDESQQYPFMSKMTEAMITTKHPAYQYENEWRLYKTKVAKEYLEYADTKGIQLKEDKGLMVPRLEIEIPVKAIEKIMIGPTAHPSRSRASLYFFLNSKGFDANKIIRQSNIPFTNE